MAIETRGLRRSRGFTLTEIAVAIGVLAVAATLAGPGLGEYLRDCRRTATLNSLAHSVHAARAAAAALGVRTMLCGTLDGRSCSRGGDWSDAVLLLPDVGAGAAAPADPLRVLRVDATRVRQTVRSNRDAIELDPLAPYATTATITVCDDRGPRSARALIVSRSGRPRLSDRDASGRLLVCP